ncbi:MAG: SpoIIE family protein phosphatase, partial [Lachnospiraceae bacterium]|nr:SpoIIE family protein phosphatase [Lachnospiraceae bacterium]
MKKIKHITSGLAFRVITAIILLLIGFGCITSIIGYMRFTRSLTAEYNDSAFRTAETAAALINPDHIESYLETSGAGEEYSTTQARLDVLCQKQNVTLLYAIAVDTTDYQSFRSVFNLVNESSGYTPWEVGYERETTNEEYRKIYQDIYENSLQRGTVARTSSLRGAEPHITSLIPLTGSDGEVKGILCVQRPMEELKNGRIQYLRWIAVTSVLLAVLVSLAAGLFLKKQFVQPVKRIIREAERFARENKVDENENLANVSSIREIETLAASIGKMEDDTLRYMENLTAITAEKERISTELSLATRIQANMLPNTFPAFPDRNDIDIYASMVPAKEVGGDFYDFFLIDNDHMGIIIADVSGKGIPAALFMMMSKILIYDYTMMGGSPKHVLEQVNHNICKNNQNEMFVTVWLGILTISTGHVVATNAGHEYPLLKDADGDFRIIKDKHGFVVGGMEDICYREYE